VNTEVLTELHEGWQLAEMAEVADVPQGAPAPQLPELAWLSARVPGSAHSALLAAGRIPDPFFGMNEAEVRWVGERGWLWRLAFDVEQLAAHEELVFEGLDTYADAWLNGAHLFSSSNMFAPRRQSARSLLRLGRNELLLRFAPPLARAREQEALHGRGALWNGDSARLHARKAQYHFGWDWGPELLVSGPWRPVLRHSWAVRIAELQCVSEVEVASRRARLRLGVQLLGELSELPADARLRFELRGPDGRVVVSHEGVLTDVSPALELEDAQLWWPRGLGAQPLYTLCTSVLSEGRTLCERQLRIGLRSLRLVQAPVLGESGSSFNFEVNGQEFFAGGANWIPDDSLLERIAPQRYRERVAQAAAANMNMLRVWGGGVYEHEAFYDACDEMGLLVWQDFMFACGQYPAHAEFLHSVREEAVAAVKRLRHHACLALWCGNNEDYALAESIGAYGPGVARERLAALAIYEQLLPEVCAACDPGTPYWPGSPYSPSEEMGKKGSTPSSDKTVGDRHSWEVWHQQMLPYQQYAQVQGRFVSEFGMQSHASLALLESVLPPEERFPESRTVMWHNKAGSGTPDGHRRLAVYMADNLRVGPTLAEHVYATQFVQAEAMRVAYQDFRRRWQQPGARACGGALVWQLNDCWPATSWALIDSAGVVKPAWHAVRRALAPLAVAVRLEPRQARLVVMNGSAGPVSMVLQLRVFAMDGRLLFERWQDQLAAGSSCMEATHALPEFKQPVVAELSALDPPGGIELARDCAWTEPFKFYARGDARLSVSREGQSLLLGVDRPLKGLWLQAPGVDWADNFIDLVPGAPRRIEVAGAWPEAIQAMALDSSGSAIISPKGGLHQEHPP